MASPDIPSSPASFKYFYTDPLAAAWMVRHHGLRMAKALLPTAEGYEEHLAEEGHALLNCTEDPAPEDVHELLEQITGDDDDADYLKGRVYIDPRSLHLLEPQVGDMIMHGSYKREQDDQPEGWSAVLVTGILSPEYDSQLREESGVTRPLCYAYDEELMISHRIIQRNGLAFMWPEREAV